MGNDNVSKSSICYKFIWCSILSIIIATFSPTINFIWTHESMVLLDSCLSKHKKYFSWPSQSISNTPLHCLLVLHSFLASSNTANATSTSWKHVALLIFSKSISVNKQINDPVPFSNIYIYIYLVDPIVKNRIVVTYLSIMLQRVVGSKRLLDGTA